MALDFKSALASVKEKGNPDFPTECLYWLLQNVRRMPTFEAGDQKDSPDDCRDFLLAQAKRQFGEMAETVFRSWTLVDGSRLFAALHLLSEMGALHLSPRDTLENFARGRAFFSEDKHED